MREGLVDGGSDGGGDGGGGGGSADRCDVPRSFLEKLRRKRRRGGNTEGRKDIEGSLCGGGDGGDGGDGGGDGDGSVGPGPSL
ncbi:hypothetical protein HZH66_004488 [Vespula vulgaris]|uniref:Uncharacterized protein n=1 Tax=Vespula vulgaris TaxID=7454 RepID=A0A834KGM6_VESVU|nr:hypothetical protein HZH66_004488 [Vespula vulgaris]